MLSKGGPSQALPKGVEAADTQLELSVVKASGFGREARTLGIY